MEGLKLKSDTKELVEANESAKRFVATKPKRKLLNKAN
jgi:hypothetical protein